MINDNQQITTIFMQIGQLQEQTHSAQKSSETAILVALISAFAAIVAAVIAGVIAWRKHVGEQQHQKQLAFIGKKTLLFDAAIDICTKLLWNKALVAANVEAVEANRNIFLLQRDCLLIESQLLVYGGSELAEAVDSFKSKILNTPPQEISMRWSEILEEGRKQLFTLKKDLGLSIVENFENFSKKITLQPPQLNQANQRVLAELGSNKAQKV